MPKSIRLRDNGSEYRLAVSDDGTVDVEGHAPIPVRPEGSGMAKVGDDPARTAWTAIDGDARWVFLDGQVFCFEMLNERARRRTAGHHGTLTAPMPATVVSVQVAPGDTVKRGDTLIVLEAMKMELPVRAPADGTVTKVNCRPGELVQPGVGLLEMS